MIAPDLKVVVLAPANVVHTQRWIEGLHARGVRLVLATQHDPGDWRPPAGVRIVRLAHAGNRGYVVNALQLRRLLRAERPDLLNAHYASGYGTLATLAGFRPRLLSVWGSDVYDFPYQSRRNGWLLRLNLRRADALASTSQAMARQVRRLLAPRLANISITPFGIDIARFAPTATPAQRGFVVGTVKTLAPKYGIDVLLRAYAEFVLAAGDRAAASTLLIVGGGEQRAELEALGNALGIAAQVRFVGVVPHAEVPAWLAGFDVYVAASRLDSESFGVAVLEASACGLPVIVSDAGGLPEVVRDGVTGLVVPRDDVAALAAALRRLFDAPALRERLGNAGRRHVARHYGWSRSLDTMLACYQRVVEGHVAPPVPIDAADLAPQIVSVIVPCRNERAHIEAFVANVLRQALPDGWSLQIVIADGGSDDGSAALLQRLSQAEPRLQVIDNPAGIVASGLNLALAQARGAVIVRMDVHTDYDADYIAQCLAALAASGADNVGGPWQARAAAGGGPMQQAVAAAFQSRWVAGGALSRRLGHDGWVDTVYLGCWPRASFERYGGFDETLVRNQDDEHNLRILRGGGRIWQSSRIRSVYRPRARLGQVLRQYVQYGYWKPFVMKKHGRAASPRHLVPGLFVGSLALATLAALLGAPAWPAVVLGGAYAVALAATTLLVARSARLGWSVAARLPAVIATYHLGYGAGSLLGAVDALRGRQGRARLTTLSR